MENKDFNIRLVEYRVILKKMAYKFTSDPDDVQDLVQETLLKALKYLDKFFNNPSVISWLYVIMKNTYINDYRTQKHKYQFDNHLCAEFKHLGYAEPSIESNIDHQFEIEDIHIAMRELPTEYQKIFDSYIKGYKYKELSKIYGLPSGTIKSRIFKIRKHLQRHFPQYN